MSNTHIICLHWVAKKLARYNVEIGVGDVDDSGYLVLEIKFQDETSLRIRWAR